MDALSPAEIFLFGEFRLDVRAGGLFRRVEGADPLAVSLGSRALNVLTILVERHGSVVSKDEILAGAWPNTVVEEANLTVQISALRRVLDVRRTGPSCIQTIPGRGYRFLPEVTRTSVAPADTHPRAEHAKPISAGPADDHPPELPGSRGSATPRRWPNRPGSAAAVCFFLAALIASVAWFPARSHRAPVVRPRLSIVVLPFKNLSGNRNEDYLADAITDDLTTDLAQRLTGGIVISRESAYTYKGKSTDAQTIGDELGVRYALEGSVRRLGTVMRVNAQLVSTETRSHIWTDHFDEPIQDIGVGQEEIVRRLGGALGWEVVAVEAERSRQERPADPDVFDLILRARSLYDQPYSEERNSQVIALSERALRLDPASAAARLILASALLDAPDYQNQFGRVATLISEAASLAPGSRGVLRLRADLLRMEERWPEAIAAAEQVIELYPNDMYAYNHLASEKLATGAANEAIPLFEKAIQLNPRSGYLFNRLRRIGFCLLMLGREQEAIAWLQRALTANPEAPALLLAANYRALASAYAWTHQPDDARRALAEANRLWPYATVRSEWLLDPSFSEKGADELRHLQEGLRRAGLRDHADENADFGVVADGSLHRDRIGLTPMTAPGVTTIRTEDLVPFLARVRPIVIDTVSNFWGRSIAGAVGLKLSGLGGSFSDDVQDRLRRKMEVLTSGDLSVPVVAMGWNSERFDGRNLALRLVAMGYTHVYWYRGGREAWEVNRLPEVALAVTDW